MKELLMPSEVSERQKICVIHGVGGIGKTQLAIEYARLHKARYTSFFWLDGKTEESLIRSLLLIASRLPKGQVPGVDNQEIKGLEESRKRAQEVLQWFAFKENTQWLLVYDNIDKTSYEEETSDQNTESSSTYDITRYFPRGDTGSIIITTRLQRLVSLGSQVHLRKVDVLDGLLILEKRAGRSLKRTGISLVERLGRLPLALVFAGSYISKTTIVKYLELYNKSWMELHKTMKNSYDYPERTIITTWQISFDELKLRNEGAAKLLQLWGYLDNHELWFQLLQWKGYEQEAPSWLQKITATELRFLATIDSLLNYSLIEQNDSNEAYSLHAVVHDWIQASINEMDGEGLLQTAITTVGLAVPGDHMRDFSALQRQLLPHVIRLSQFWSQASEIQNTLNDNPYLASLHNLGNLYQNQDRLTEAEAVYKQALVGYEKVLGTEHISTLHTVRNLGQLYQVQGRLAEAEAMYKRALVGYEKALGTEHVSALVTVDNLGNLYQNQDRFAEAEAMYKRSLMGKEKALSTEHTSTLDTVNNLGILCLNQGRLAEAEAMYQRALMGYEKVLGTEHVSTLVTVDNLGNLYQKQGRFAEAEAMYKRALVGREKALGTEHMSTLHTVNRLGNLYQDQDRLAEAEAMYKQALVGREKVLGTEHESALDTVNNLGKLYCKQGRLAEAEAMYKRALLGYEKVLGTEHTSTLHTVHNLGKLYQDQGQPAEAESMYKRALVGREKALGIEHALTLDTVNNLGNLYCKQGRLAEAEAMYKRALVGMEKVLGIEHMSTLGTVNSLGILYLLQGRLAEAEAMYKRALVGREKVFGTEHTSTLFTVNSLGIIYCKQGRLAEAEAMYMRALVGYEKVLGTEHASTLFTINSLEALYCDQGRLAEADAMHEWRLK
ncbi:TPR-like protein [Hyaloscypha hepaticicola]|uniref:TPR-like protein n=1 Tax=Hyaloscypha hepaticicola TaxID=2082293 RepID=A0A2J6Q4J6_9HELO|nr:TPR-like protein [Hyaloscypha hepaticicola]